MLAETPSPTGRTEQAGQWTGHGWVHCKWQVSSFQVDLLGLCLVQLHRRDKGLHVVKSLSHYSRVF